MLGAARRPRWLGLADVAVAALLFAVAVILATRGRHAVDDRHRVTALRVSGGVAAIIPALLSAYFVLGPRVDWAVLVIGLAWRGWLLLYTLPVLVAALSVDVRTGMHAQNEREDSE